MIDFDFFGLEHASRLPECPKCIYYKICSKIAMEGVQTEVLQNRLFQRKMPIAPSNMTRCHNRLKTRGYRR